MFSPIPKHFFVSIFAVVHAAEYAPISWQSARCFHSQGSSSRAMPHGDVPSGKVAVQRLAGQNDQRKEQRIRSDRSKRLLGTLGLRMLGGAKKERFLCSRDVNGAQLRR